jgi:hypothetical protein
VALSAERLEAWLAADLSRLDLLAVQIAGIHLAEAVLDDSWLAATVGIDRAGTQHPCVMVEGATENAAVMQVLLDDLAKRGLHPSVSRLPQRHAQARCVHAAALDGRRHARAGQGLAQAEGHESGAALARRSLGAPPEGRSSLLGCSDQAGCIVSTDGTPPAMFNIKRLRAPGWPGFLRSCSAFSRSTRPHLRCPHRNSPPSEITFFKGD